MFYIHKNLWWIPCFYHSVEVEPGDHQIHSCIAVFPFQFYREEGKHTSGNHTGKNGITILKGHLHDLTLYGWCFLHGWHRRYKLTLTNVAWQKCKH
jgi:hypothetical protein